MSDASIEELKGMLREVLDRLGPREAAPRTNYSVEEAAEILGKQPYTVREWCRLGRINATRRGSRRGKVALWNVPADELDRFRDHGLLPIDTGRNA